MPDRGSSAALDSESLQRHCEEGRHDPAPSSRSMLLASFSRILNLMGRSRLPLPCGGLTAARRSRRSAATGDFGANLLPLQESPRRQGASEIRRLTQLEDETAKLKRVVRTSRSTKRCCRMSCPHIARRRPPAATRSRSYGARESHSSWSSGARAARAWDTATCGGTQIGKSPSRKIAPKNGCDGQLELL